MGAESGFIPKWSFKYRELQRSIACARMLIPDKDKAKRGERTADGCELTDLDHSNNSSFNSQHDQPESRGNSRNPSPWSAPDQVRDPQPMDGQAGKQGHDTSDSESASSSGSASDRDNDNSSDSNSNSSSGSGSDSDSDSASSRASSSDGGRRGRATIAKRPQSAAKGPAKVFVLGPYSSLTHYASNHSRRPAPDGKQLDGSRLSYHRGVRIGWPRGREWLGSPPRTWASRGASCGILSLSVRGLDFFWLL